MLKVIGWVRANGNMNLTKYMDYLSQAGLDDKTLELTKVCPYFIYSPRYIS